MTREPLLHSQERETSTTNQAPKPMTNMCSLKAHNLEPSTIECAFNFDSRFDVLPPSYPTPNQALKARLSFQRHRVFRLDLRLGRAPKPRLRFQLLTWGLGPEPGFPPPEHHYFIQKQKQKQKQTTYPSFFLLLPLTEKQNRACKLHIYPYKLNYTFPFHIGLFIPHAYK